MTAPDRPLPQPSATEKRLRAAGEQLVARLGALFRIGRAYDVENAVFQRQLEGLESVLGPLLAEHGQAEIAFLESDFYLNGVRVPVRSPTFRLHGLLAKEFRRRRIVGLRFLPGLERVELERFYRLFARAEEYRGAALVAACREQDLRSIEPGVRATTEAAEERAFDDDALAADESDDSPEEEREGGEGPASPRGRARRGTASSASRRRFDAAVTDMRNLLTTTVLQKGVDLRRARRVVQPLIDLTGSGDPVVYGLPGLAHHDERTYTRAVNACLVAVAIGRTLGLDRRALSDLSLAALLCDVGMAAGGAPDASAGPEARAAWLERHPLESVRLIAASTRLDASVYRCLRVALEHHRGEDGSGYPECEGGGPSSVLSRIVAVAVAYVSLITRRADGGTLTPREALGALLGPLRSRHDPAVLWALVQSLGLYPPGQVVALDDGSMALVLAPDPDDLERPYLRVIADAAGRLIPASEVVEHLPLPAERRIARALSADQYPTGSRSGDDGEQSLAA